MATVHSYCHVSITVLQDVPRYTETGEIVRGHVMHVSWSADHRVIDGALLAKFSNLWRSYSILKTLKH